MHNIETWSEDELISKIKSQTWLHPDRLNLTCISDAVMSALIQERFTVSLFNGPVIWLMRPDQIYAYYQSKEEKFQILQLLSSIESNTPIVLPLEMIEEIESSIEDVLGLDEANDYIQDNHVHWDSFYDEFMSFLHKAKRHSIALHVAESLASHPDAVKSKSPRISL